MMPVNVLGDVGEDLALNVHRVLSDEPLAQFLRCFEFGVLLGTEG
jgi:hypothetical protein